MKNVFLSLMLLSAFVVVGQEKQGSATSKGYNGERMTPEQRATLQTKKMTLALDLSKEQQQKIEKLNLENANLRKSEMEAFRTKKENGEAQKPTAAERYERVNNRLDHRIALQEQMKKILDEGQYDKWKRMTQRDGKYHGHRDIYMGHNNHQRRKDGAHGKK